MSDDCNHGHNSQSEESYFYKETKRLVEDLRRMAAAMAEAEAQPKHAALTETHKAA